MNNHLMKIIFFWLFFLLISCRETGNHYSSVSNSNIERVELKKIKNIKLSFSAIKEDENLEISFYINSDNKLANIHDIKLQINGLENLISKNKVYYTNDGNYTSFKEFAEIKKNINHEIKHGNYIIIYYNFKDSSVLKIDNLHFNVLLKSNLGNINEKISMKRHSSTFIFGK